MPACAVAGCNSYYRKTKGTDIKYFGVTTENLSLISKGADKEINWVQFLLKGRLTYPSDHLIEATKIFEIEFNNLNKKSLSNERLLFDRLVERTRQKLPLSIKIPDDVLTCLARTRTYIRLRDLNKNISRENCKRKLNKKLSKFTFKI